MYFIWSALQASHHTAPSFFFFFPFSTESALFCRNKYKKFRMLETQSKAQDGLFADQRRVSIPCTSPLILTIRVCAAASRVYNWSPRQFKLACAATSEVYVTYKLVALMPPLSPLRVVYAQRQPLTSIYFKSWAAVCARDGWRLHCFRKSETWSRRNHFKPKRNADLRRSDEEAAHRRTGCSVLRPCSSRACPSEQITCVV